MNQTSRVIHHLRNAVLIREGAGLTDGQLLECFIEHRDEAAFAALVRRHGPMVWGVCRRLLRYHDAEDAFQSTFLVLYQKAASIQPRKMAANWLHGVAHHTALQARRAAARRSAREKQVMEMPEPAFSEEGLWRDLQPFLDEELSRLPEKYRVVIVTCDLEGKTRKEAARQLAVPEGTVAGWLARARTLLAKRLVRHGVTVSGGALASILSQNMTSAGLPAFVVAATIKAARLYASNKSAVGVFSAQVAALMEGAQKGMLFCKIKSVAARLALLVVLGAGLSVGGWTGWTNAALQPKPEQGNHLSKASRAEKTGFLGTWKAVSVKVNGEAYVQDPFLTKQPVTAITWTFTGHKVYIRGGDRSIDANYTLDSSVFPPQIDLTFIIRDDLGENNVQVERLGRGIYDIFAGDKLELCFIINPNLIPYRPRNMDARVRMTYYYTFQRQ